MNIRIFMYSLQNTCFYYKKYIPLIAYLIVFTLAISVRDIASESPAIMATNITPIKKVHDGLKYALLLRSPTLVDSEDEEIEDDIVLHIQGFSNSLLNGQYIRSEDDINGLPHYEKILPASHKYDTVHLYWSLTSNQWVINKEIESALTSDNLLAYAKIKVKHPVDTSRSWHSKHGKGYEPCINVIITSDAMTDISKDGQNYGLQLNANEKATEEILGIPKKLLPLYAAFMLDSIAVGMAMPLLPFFVMELGAKALQLSFVVSSNYIVQMVGCLVMGTLSDRVGRRFVLLCCLAASSLSYYFVSQSYSLSAVAWARVIVGSCGGLVPVMQTCVADVSNTRERPKYLGRVTATFGLGFVLGPVISALLPHLSIRNKIKISALLPLTGFLVAFAFFKETKVKLDNQSESLESHGTLSISGTNKKTSPLSSDRKGQILGLPIMLLVLNGFLIMYAFATETIYAIFLKDAFGYGERILSILFAVNGLFIGIFQIFFIKPLVNTLGKHFTLIAGNLMLAVGMVGVALVRKEVFHFMLFTLHIVGYSIADTALASLISRYSNPSTQGRDLALNQAAQSCARVLSPLFAGMLYERSKSAGPFPQGALPFLAGALFPAFGIVIPLILYIKNIAAKKKKKPSKENLL